MILMNGCLLGFRHFLFLNNNVLLFCLHLTAHRRWWPAGLSKNSYEVIFKSRPRKMQNSAIAAMTSTCPSHSNFTEAFKTTTTKSSPSFYDKHENRNTVHLPGDEASMTTTTSCSSCSPRTKANALGSEGCLSFVVDDKNVNRCTSTIPCDETSMTTTTSSSSGSPRIIKANAPAERCLSFVVDDNYENSMTTTTSCSSSSPRIKASITTAASGSSGSLQSSISQDTSSRTSPSGHGTKHMFDAGDLQRSHPVWRFCTICDIGRFMMAGRGSFALVEQDMRWAGMMDDDCECQDCGFLSEAHWS